MSRRVIVGVTFASIIGALLGAPFPAHPQVGLRFEVEGICKQLTHVIVNGASGSPEHPGYGRVLLNYPWTEEAYNRATCTFPVDESGTYRLSLRYAADAPRPTNILINNVLITENGAADTTGGWAWPDQKPKAQGTVQLTGNRNNTITFERNGPLPHISSITFEKIN